MPFTGQVSSVLSTLDEVVAHWTLVDAAVGGGEMKICEGMGRAGFEALRAEWLEVLAGLEGWKNGVTAARGAVERRKAELGVRLAQFGGRLRGLVGGTVWEAGWMGVLPYAPSARDGTSVWLERMEALLGVWERWESGTGSPGFPPGGGGPVVLPGGYGLVELRADVRGNKATGQSGLVQLEQAVVRALGDLAQGLAHRDGLRSRLKGLVRSYRAMVGGSLPAGHALLKSVPRYSARRRKSAERTCRDPAPQDGPEHEEGGAQSPLGGSDQFQGHLGKTGEVHAAARSDSYATGVAPSSPGLPEATKATLGSPRKPGNRIAVQAPETRASDSPPACRQESPRPQVPQAPPKVLPLSPPGDTSQRPPHIPPPSDASPPIQPLTNPARQLDLRSDRG